ncbi:hypothetical protein Poly30_13690 [Planctomycetes bacterium Poly30]|uniref:Uncharacterized protein n=1 Tax=Saltatorellus ferox TaxID=2528018 RepID=A0A518EP57_9BACT|nr:hypothetical protein Poly30_13690 [Planctomycetes bacterium Poly30]
MNAFSKSVWIAPAARGALDPARTVHARMARGGPRIAMVGALLQGLVSFGYLKELLSI